MAIINVLTNIKDGYLEVKPVDAFFSGSRIITNALIRTRIRLFNCEIQLNPSNDILYQFNILNFHEELVWNSYGLVDSSITSINLTEIVEIMSVAPWNIGLNYLISNLLTDASFAAFVSGLNPSPDGVSWSEITANQSLLSNRGYFVNALTLITLTLPSAANGDTVIVVDRASGFRINATGTVIRNENNQTSIGGYIQSLQVGTTVRLQRTSTNLWICIVEAGVIEII